MDLEQLRALLTKAESHHQPKRETSIFALGGRGYYENPMTDLLAFFLDPAQAHGLGDCFLSALLSCVPNMGALNPSLRSAPRREVATHNNNRIDLVLSGDDWDLLIENKIFHGQVNPFTDYEEFAQCELNDGKRQLFYLVLSPSGLSLRASWHGLNYSTLITATRQQLGQRMVAQPFNKWQVFARDFLLHLENITVERAMDADAISFVFEHMQQINKLNKLREQAINALDRKVLHKLESDVLGFERFTRRHNWQNGPALRYASNNWEQWSDVVLYLSGASDPMKPSVRVYLCKVDAVLAEQGRKLFAGNQSKMWNEGKNNNILAFSWVLDHFDEEVVLALVSEKMQLLMKFEMEVRPQFSSIPNEVTA